MVAFHGNETPAVAAAYDFSGVRTVVDVGGATGNLLAAILERHPHLQGILFDLPHVVRDAAPLLERKRVAHRVQIKPGSFFEAILENCRNAITPQGRLLVVEMVLPSGDAPHPGKLLDVAMLVQAGGRERTAAEYGDLLQRARFNVTRVIRTESPASVVEALPQQA